MNELINEWVQIHFLKAHSDHVIFSIKNFQSLSTTYHIKANCLDPFTFLSYLHYALRLWLQLHYTVISRTHPVLTSTAFPHLIIFAPYSPSVSIPFSSLPVTILAFKYLPFRTQLKCNLHKDSPDSHPNFPNFSSSSKHQKYIILV